MTTKSTDVLSALNCKSRQTLAISKLRNGFVLHRDQENASTFGSISFATTATTAAPCKTLSAEAKKMGLAQNGLALSSFYWKCERPPDERKIESKNAVEESKDAALPNNQSTESSKCVDGLKTSCKQSRYVDWDIGESLSECDQDKSFGIFQHKQDFHERKANGGAVVTSQALRETKRYRYSDSCVQREPQRPGRTVPFSWSIVGANTEGSADHWHLSCTSCGRRGHLGWECPILLCKKFQEQCPGFDDEGNRLPECWDEGLCITEETRKAWKGYIRKYFYEPVPAWPASTDRNFNLMNEYAASKNWKLGKTIPCSAAIVGTNTKGSVHRENMECRSCSCHGHLSWECPISICALFGEACPGFDSKGNKLQECWENGIWITEKTREAWRRYVQRHFILHESAGPEWTDESFEALWAAPDFDVCAVGNSKAEAGSHQCTLGLTVPCAASIVGANTKGAVERAESVCSVCRRKDGHLCWECPKLLFRMFGEAPPGFNCDGSRRYECWKDELFITEETRAEWRDYVSFYFEEAVREHPTSTGADFELDLNCRAGKRIKHDPRIRAYLNATAAAAALHT